MRRNSSNRGSNDFSIGRSNNPSGFFTRNNSVIRRRSSVRSAGSVASGGIGGIGAGGRNLMSRMFIGREEFVEHYPQLLIEVTVDNDLNLVGGSFKSTGDGVLDNPILLENPGIDITFQGKEIYNGFQIAPCAS